MEGHGDHGGLCGLAVPRARRGGEESDRWGQAASEGGGARADWGAGWIGGARAVKRGERGFGPSAGSEGESWAALGRAEGKERGRRPGPAWVLGLGWLA